MAIRASEGLVNLLKKGYGMRDAMRGMTIYSYDGSQPGSGDDDPTGTNLLLFTKDGNTFTAPTRAMATITMAGTGTLDTVTVGGAGENLLAAAVAIAAGDLGGSADLVAASINSKDNAQHIVAVSDSVDTVTLYQPYHMAAQGNGLTLAITQTTSTCTNDASFSGGIDVVNGMDFEIDQEAGKIDKPDSEVWQATGLVKGTAGWFRAVAGGSLPGDLAADRVSFDGQLASSGGDLDMGSLSIEVGGVQTIARLSITMPQSV